MSDNGEVNKPESHNTFLGESSGSLTTNADSEQSIEYRDTGSKPGPEVDEIISITGTCSEMKTGSHFIASEVKVKDTCTEDTEMQLKVCVEEVPTCISEMCLLKMTYYCFDANRARVVTFSWEGENLLTKNSLLFWLFIII